MSAERELFFPLNLLKDSERLLAWTDEVGKAEHVRQMRAAVDRYMTVYGNLAIFDITELLDNANTCIEEFLV